MFVNLSNHPSSLWGEEQTNAAQVYGKIVDLRFPTISPCCSSKEVQAMAEEYYKQVVSLIGEEKETSAIHLMGEMVFVFVLTTLLTQSGYTVLVSTTERNVSYDDGKKVSEFKFVQFRSYPKMNGK